MKYAILLLVVSLLPGCTYPRFVVWDPDSKGFLYLSDKGEIASYDVGTRKSKLFHVEEKWTVAELKPAISPDGEQVTIFRVVADDKQI